LGGGGGGSRWLGVRVVGESIFRAVPARSVRDRELFVVGGERGHESGDARGPDPTQPSTAPRREKKG